MKKLLISTILFLALTVPVLPNSQAEDSAHFLFGTWSNKILEQLEVQPLERCIIMGVIAATKQALDPNFTSRDWLLSFSGVVFSFTIDDLMLGFTQAVEVEAEG